MSKAKYAIRNGDENIGILWEHEMLGNIFVTTGSRVDLNYDLEIYNIETGKLEEQKDMRDFLMESLPIPFVDNRVEEEKHSPSESLEQSLKEMKLMREGKLHKKTWDELKKELQE